MRVKELICSSSFFISQLDCNFRPHFPGKILQYPRLIKRLLCLPGVATPSLHPLASLQGYPALIRNLITKMKTTNYQTINELVAPHVVPDGGKLAGVVVSMYGGLSYNVPYVA